MCGLAGIYRKKENVTNEELRAMAAAIRHRGPDSSGFYVSPDKSVGLAHNRLSIIDLSESANQPMCDERGKIWLIFNGEIYNYLELRRSLLEKGHRFKSKSDSEVILHLYEEKGIDLLGDLNGMFALALFDENTGAMYLARDRVGIKPLYYSFKNGGLAFASEVKSLLGLPHVSRDLDLRALDFYFAMGYIPSDLCIFKDIRKLKPAHYLRFNEEAVQTARYWSLTTSGPRAEAVNDGELVDILEEKLRNSVRGQMVSDVPVGCFLSGGLDSSLVAKLMAQEAGQPINTFTIRFDSPGHDESAFARIMARDIKSEHHESLVKIDAAEAMDKLVGHFDEPFADSSLIPTYYVSKLARERVTVILSGDGGDELFGGYNWYSWVLRLSKTAKSWDSWARRLSGLGGILPDGSRAGRFFSALGQDPAEQFLERVSIFNGPERGRLYARSLSGLPAGRAPETEIQDFFRGVQGDLVSRMTITDFHYYLPEDILTKVDRASMAVSLETRVPWLDHELAEFAFSLPSDFRIRAGEKKFLPKLLARKMLPPDLPLQRKQGFCIPVDDWMRGRLGTVLEEELNANGGSVKRILNLDYVRGLMARHRKHPGVGLGTRLFSILVFSKWFRRYSGAP